MTKAPDPERASDLTLLAERATAAAVVVGMVLDQAIAMGVDPPAAALEFKGDALSMWAVKLYDEAAQLAKPGSPPESEPVRIRRELRPALGWLGW
jgi:hypothetical protein